MINDASQYRIMEWQTINQHQTHRKFLNVMMWLTEVNNSNGYNYGMWIYKYLVEITNIWKMEMRRIKYW